MEVTFDDFLKFDMRIGKVVEAENIVGSRNLIKMTVDFGFEKRQSVAGLRKYYKTEDLMEKKFCFVLNMQRRKIMGVESQCMILAAEDDDDNVVLLKPEKDVHVGSKIG